MRLSGVVILAVSLGIAAGAQAPPAGARDISQMPAAPTVAASPAPAATAPELSSSNGGLIAAPADAVRIYIDNLTGADTTAVSSLLAQALYQSKQVVVTENQSNASVSLRGEVVRELPPTPQAASRKRSRTRPAAAANGGAEAAEAGANDGLASASGADTPDLNGFSLTALPGLANPGAPVDLSQYRYRLNLELLDPAGDVLWMSGRGEQALPFQTATAAVNQTVSSLLQALAALKAAAPAVTP